MSQVATLLGEGGAIAARLPGYELRPQQLDLAGAVEASLAEGRHLLAEAGTGVGKSFAYLLPAVLHAQDHHGEGPIVVSTRTIALQEQLERKDLPFLKAVLPLEWSSVTAVGRNNYVCLRRLNLAWSERRSLFGDNDHELELRQLVDWSLRTHDGTRMELEREVDPRVWEEVRAEHGNCLYKACKYYDPCPYQRSRRRMEAAHVLVVNHSLYMADVALRMAGARYLPDHRVVVFDEAHHLERVATESLGLRLGRPTLLWHLRRLHPRNAARSILLNHGSRRAIELAEHVRDATQVFFDELDARLEVAGGQTLALGQAAIEEPLSPLLDELGGELTVCAGDLEQVDLKLEMQARAKGLQALAAVVRQTCAPGADGIVRWLERAKAGAELRTAPLDVSEALRQHVFAAPRTAVLLSATLGPGGDPDFAWLRRQLGIDAATALRLGSPFDYRRAVELVCEEGLPDPGREPREFQRQVSARVVHWVLENGGRALVLCTSWSAVREIAAALAEPLQERGIRLLVQGEAPLHRLLADKKSDPTSVLVGTDTLWEGIDVPGDALTLVVVTRLPFAQPGHPLTEARLRAIEARGGNGFADQSLPEAVLKFRQGFGRLIRSQQDHGRVVVLDPRVRTKAYGRRFLDALPEGVQGGLR